MTGYGLLLMLVSCGFVIVLNVFCFARVLRKRKKSSRVS